MRRKGKRRWWVLLHDGVYGMMNQTQVIMRLMRGKVVKMVVNPTKAKEKRKVTKKYPNSVAQVPSQASPNRLHGQPRRTRGNAKQMSLPILQRQRS